MWTSAEVRAKQAEIEIETGEPCPRIVAEVWLEQEENARLEAEW